MIVIGLTGGMGVGKSTLARYFSLLGWPIFDADAEVRRMQGKCGEAVEPIRRLWPQTFHQGAINRERLRQQVLLNPRHLKQLEAIVHPLVAKRRRAFLLKARRMRVAGCILDIPLLFEVGADKECDKVIVVTASLSTRLHRIRARRAISLEQARILISRQMDDSFRMKKADALVYTGLSRWHAVMQIRRLLLQWQVNL